MKKLLTPLVILTACTSFSACNIVESNPFDGGEVSCTGFSGPDLNIFVHDSMDENISIENATIFVQTSDGESVTSSQPIFDSGDSLANSMEGAYYSSLDYNNGHYEIEFSVEAPGYHTFVTKDFEIDVDTSCADNNFVYDVYLCELGTTCL